MPLMRPCTVCGTPRRGGNCPAHKTVRPRRRKRDTRSRQERGYGKEYDQARAVLRNEVEQALIASRGVPCSICGNPIARIEDFSAEHVVPLREGGDHQTLLPAHKRCNSSRRRVGSGQAPPVAR